MMDKMNVFPISTITMEEVNKYIDDSIKEWEECMRIRKIIKLLWRLP